jgi:PAS domain S-box-containing protein
MIPHRETVAHLTKTTILSRLLIDTIEEARCNFSPFRRCCLATLSPVQVLGKYRRRLSSFCSFRSADNPDRFAEQRASLRQVVPPCWQMSHMHVTHDLQFDAQMASLPLSPLTGDALSALPDPNGDHPEAAADLICRYLPDTTLTYVNDAYCARFGPRDTLLGRGFLELLPEAEREPALRHVESLIAHPRIETWEHEVLLPDRSTGWQEWLDFVIVGNDGTVIELQGIGRDITERKRHERSLAAQYAVTRILADGYDLEQVTNDFLSRVSSWLGFDVGALWVAGDGDEVLRCAGVKGDDAPDVAEFVTLTRLLSIGPDRESLTRLAWSADDQLWHEHLDMSRSFSRRRWASKAGLTVGLWTPVRSLDRRIGVLEFLGRATPRPDPGSLRTLEAIGLQLGQFIERSRVQQALGRSEARFRALIQHATDGVLIVTVDDLIGYCSESAGAILGVAPEALLGTSFFSLVHPDDLAAARRFLASAPRRHKNDPTEVWVRCGGDSWCLIEARATNLRAVASVGGIVVNFRDVTAQRQSESALRQLTGRLLRFQDEERRRIALDLHDGTAQDLMAIGFNLDRLRRRVLASDVEADRQLAEGEGLVQKALRDIRTLSYVLHPPLLDEDGLTAALRWLVEGFAARSGIAVNLVETDDVGRLPRDVEIALFRVAQESLTNVHRHSGSKTATMSLTRGRDAITLQVKDRGRGGRMGQETGMETPKAESGVLGVGIAGMKERLRQLGGTLVVTTTGQGTTVIATVPLPGGDA